MSMRIGLGLMLSRRHGLASEPAAPVNVIAPAVSGDAEVGSTLTVSNGSWTGHPIPTFTYQWRKGAVNIVGETANTYMTVSGDIGAAIDCVVTGTNSEGSASQASSNSVTVVEAAEAPTNVTPPGIDGSTAVGSTLTVNPGIWDGTPTPSLTYQWIADEADMAGETGQTLELTASEEGAQIKIRETASNSAGSASETSAAVGPVTAGSGSTVQNLAVSSDGWTLDATILGAVDGGTYAGLNDYVTPGLQLTVRSKSWDAAGVEITTNRTVIATAAKRKPYPDHAILDETEVASDVDVVFVLSNRIYASDTITASAIAADLYTDNGTGGSGETRGGGSPSVTNNSTRAYPLPVGMWLNHDRDWVKAGTYTVRLAVAHEHFRSGQMVRAVKFIATDASLNTTSTIVTAMSKVDYTGSGLSASCYEGTLDFTGLTQGELVTIDAVIYPWVGDAHQVSVDGAVYPSPNLTVLKVLNDRANGYGTAYAYVDAVGGGTPAVHETAATAATTPYATIAAAASALQTYINANFGRNNVSGGIIRLTATSHVHSTYAARAVGEIPLLIEAANPADKATTIYQDAGTSVSNGCCDYLKIKDVTLRKTGASIIFLDMTASLTGAFALILENCTFDLNGQTVYNAWIYRPGHLYLINCDGDDCGQGGQFSTAAKQVNAWGSGNGSVASANFNAVGCKSLPGIWTAGPSNMQTPAGSFLGWSHVGTSTDSAKVINVARVIGAAGIAIVGCAIEKYTNVATGQAFVINGDGNVDTGENVLDIANTVVGQRSNVLYNDSGVAAVPKSGISSHSVHLDWNSKSDVFATNGALIGNWPVIYRVGSSYRVALVGSSGADTPAPGSWIGEIAARGDLIGTDAVPISPDWTADQSGSAGAGNGDYTPGASTALPQIPAGETGFPFDMKGRAVPTDGTAYVGAIQAAQ